MKKLLKVGVAVAFLCSAIYATPGKTATGGLYSNPADDVTSKMGLGGISFDKVFIAGEYTPEEINFLTATKFGDVFMGAMYQGNFFKSTGMNVTDENGILGSTTSHGVNTRSENKNSLLLAFHLPGTLPMGVSVGVDISGEYRKGNYDENFSVPSANSTKDHRVGFVDNLLYTPKAGFAIRLPLENGFAIRPQIDVEFGYKTNESKTDYIENNTGGGIS